MSVAIKRKVLNVKLARMQNILILISSFFTQGIKAKICSIDSTSSECKVLGEYIDDLSSSITVNDVDQISKSTFSVPKVPESRLESTATPSIGHAQPSTSVDTYGLGNTDFHGLSLSSL